jgi:hypothetical protein
MNSKDNDELKVLANEGHFMGFTPHVFSCKTFGVNVRKSNLC